MNPRILIMSDPGQGPTSQFQVPESHLGQVQVFQSESKQSPMPVVKPVSLHSRPKSHSPCRRIDVDVEPEYRTNWSSGLKPSLSHNNIFLRADSESFEESDPLSKSYPANGQYINLPRQRNSYSPASSSGNILRVPSNNHLLSPPSLMYGGDIGVNKKSIKSSNSLCDLTDTAPGNILKQAFDKIGRKLRRSSDVPRPTFLATPVSRQGFSLENSPQGSPLYSPPSPELRSSRHLSPTFSPDNDGPYINGRWSPTFAPTLKPGQDFFMHSSASNAPRCSPHGSPYGSQAQITITSSGPLWPQN